MNSAAAITAAILVVTGPATPAPAPSAAPSAFPSREVVYRFSYDRWIESTEKFIDGSSSSHKNRTDAFKGTLTIDITAIDADGTVQAKARDEFDAGADQQPAMGDFLIFPDGSLAFADGSHDDGMITLLPFFATKCFGDHDLQKGASWQIGPTADENSRTTKYAVKAVEGDVATITTESQGKGGTPDIDVTVQTTVDYKASVLEPTSLDVLIVSSGKRLASMDLQNHYHFERVSDTRDTPAHH